MASSPKFKVYNSERGYIGCVKHAEDAAVLVSVQGVGSTVRHGHAVRDIVWTEGVDGFAAGSYDIAAEVMHARIGGER
jgi:hypothetical protein